MWRLGLRVVLFVFALAIGTVAWLGFTESGARVGIAWVSGLVPNFKATHASGALAGPLQLKTLVVKTGTFRLEANGVLLDWSPPCLLIGEACIREARVQKLQLALPAAKPAAAPGTRRHLPTLSLPLAIDLDQLAIGELEIARGEQRTRYTGLALAAYWRDMTLQVEHLVVGMPTWQATANGTLATRDDWPLDARLTFAMPREGAPRFALSGAAGGSLADTRLVLDSSGLIVARIDGRLATLTSGLPFNATLQAERFLVPPSGDPAKSVQVQDIRLDGRGELLGRIELSGGATIDTPWTPAFAATLAGNGTWRGLEALSLDINDPRLRATISSDYRWLGGQHFAGRVDLRHLDLALINPTTTSALRGTLRVKGDIDAQGTAARIDVDTLSGTFRQWPLTVRGPLRWQDAQWHFDDLALHIGDNTVHVRGTLGNTWNADATLALGDLTDLLPAFAGTATGTAHIDGEPTVPRFSFALDGRDMRLPTIALPLPGGPPRDLRLPANAWRIEGIATLDDVNLTDAHTVAPAEGSAPFAAQASGTVSWKDALRWDLDTVFTDLGLHDLLPELGGRVSGPLATRGVLGETLESISIDTRLDGQLDGLPLAIDAALTRDGRGTDVERLRLAHGDNRLAARGGFDTARIALSLDVDAPDLARSFRELSGSIRASAAAGGTPRAPDVDASVDIRGLAWRDLSITQATLRASLVDGGSGASSLVLASGALHYGDDALDGASLAVNGTRGQHRIDAAIAGAPLAATLALQGGLDDDALTRWHGNLVAGQLDVDDWRWQSSGEPALTVDGQSLAVAPHCWNDGSARACLTRDSILGASGTVAGEFFHVPVDRLLGDLLPLDTDVTGNVGGFVDARWQAGQLASLTATVQNGGPLRLMVGGDDVESARDIGQIDTLLAHIDGDRRRLSASAVLQGADTGSVGGLVTLAPLAGIESGLDGTVHIEGLRIDLAEAFTYQLRDIGGTLDGTLGLDGTVGVPRIAGDVGLRDGRLGFTRLPVSLVDITIGSRFDGNRIDIDGTFRTPESKGKARIAGSATLAGGTWHGEGTLGGEPLVIASPPEFQFTVVPALRLDATPGLIALRGTVRVPAGRIDIKSLPTQSVSRSRDVIIVQHSQPVATADVGGVAFNQDVDMDFLLGEDISFRAFGGEGFLGGDLRVRSRPQVPLQVDGELHVKEGKYVALGQSLKLKNTDIIFNGPADQPLVDALAVREIDDAAVREVGLRLTGSLRAPQTTLYSSPALPDEQALVWLTTGRAPAEGPINLRGEAANAAMSLGVAQGSALLSAAGREIGLQDVQLATTGQGDEAEVQVGTNLNERVFVGYNRRVFTGDESVMVRLQMTRRLMLEALSGLESAVDVFYTFEF